VSAPLEGQECSRFSLLVRCTSASVKHWGLRVLSDSAVFIRAVDMRIANTLNDMARVRRRWWELDHRAKKYVEERSDKRFSITNNSILYFLLKNRDFTCAWYNKSMPVEERLHFALVEAMHRNPNALAFITLEIERNIFRNAKRMVPILKLLLNEK